MTTGAGTVARTVLTPSATPRHHTIPVHRRNCLTQVAPGHGPSEEPVVVGVEPGRGVPNRPADGGLPRVGRDLDPGHGGGPRGAHHHLRVAAPTFDRCAGRCHALGHTRLDTIPVHRGHGSIQRRPGHGPPDPLVVVGAERGRGVGEHPADLDVGRGGHDLGHWTGGVVLCTTFASPASALHVARTVLTPSATTVTTPVPSTVATEPSKVVHDTVHPTGSVSSASNAVAL
jgi:hypothetical protein